MTLEVLISAMHQKDLSIAEKSNCRTDVLIINQTDREGYDETERNGHRVRMYSTAQRGVAKSRNMALMHASGDICLLCDDDEYLENDYAQTILTAFEKYPEADIIAFDVIFPKKKKRYVKMIDYAAKRKAGISPRFKGYGTWRIAFRRESVIRNGVWFNPLIGPGSGVIASGEETAWQAEARRKGLKRYYYPKVIAQVFQEQSTWFTGLNEKYYYDLGANLAINEPALKHLLKYYYIVNIQGSQLSKAQQLKYLNAGISGFGKHRWSYEQYKKNREKI